MIAPPLFAQAIADMNASVVDVLGNVVVILAGVERVVLFTKSFYGSTIGDSGIASAQSSLTLQSVDVPPQISDWFRYYTEPFNPLDLLVNVADANYKIVAHEPNGAGLSRLILELV